MEKFYITTAIDYANAPPHIGHAYEKVIADVLARWHRSCGDETFFLTGTDEHGAKNARSAEKVGITPLEFVEGHRAEFQKLLAYLNISNDDFVYTADRKRHWPGVEKIWRTLESAGDLYKAQYKGLYCVGHEAFVTEKDLVNGVCVDHNQKPEVIEEENYFFRLTKYVPRVIKALEKDEYRIMPKARKNEVLAFLKSSVEDISFSRPARDISWGIPVPGDPEHMIYVWADALPNYLTALGFGRADDENFKKFWPADVHVIGKDILRFHAVIWPAMLLAVGLPLPKMAFVHGMILTGGQKMSKTIGNVIHPQEIIDQYGVDAFRFFMTREISFGEDGDLTRERFSEVYEGSLAHGIGNLVSRTAAMITKYNNGALSRPTVEALAQVPTRRAMKQEASDSRILLEGENLERYFNIEVVEEYQKAMSELRLTDAITLLMNFFSLLDGYVQDYEPYRLVKTDPKKTTAVLWNLAAHIVRNSKLLEPFMPETSRLICEIFGSQDGIGDIVVKDHKALFPSKKV
ncbi:MAG: methionine--tRNA ligase [Patescibacteria group bacterium]